MSARDILLRHQVEAGWTDETALDALIDYIDNQQADDAFEDYLKQRRENEDE